MISQRSIALLSGIMALVIIALMWPGVSGGSLCPLSRVGAQANPCLAQDATISAMQIKLLEATFAVADLKATIVSLENQITAGGQPPTAIPSPTPTTFEIDTSQSPAWGWVNASVTIIEFSDFECPFCARFHEQAYKQIRSDFGDTVRFVYKHFPLVSIHPNAFNAALASECAREQDRFWEYHDLLYANQRDLSLPALEQYAIQAEVADIDQYRLCMESEKYRARIQEDIAEAERIGVGGTPTFFINGKPLIGAQPYEAFRTAIEDAIRSAKQ